MNKRYLKYILLCGVIFIILLFGIKVAAVDKDVKKDTVTVEEFFSFRYDDVSDIIKKMIEKNRKIEKKFFDEIFGEDFFDRKYDPFIEIERFRKRMIKIFGGDNRKIFENDFNEWFDKRIKLDDIKVNEFNDRIEINIPDVKRKNVSINVGNDYIKISYDITQKNDLEKDNYKKSIYASEKYIKYIKLNEKFKNKQHSIEIDDDKITIKFSDK